MIFIENERLMALDPSKNHIFYAFVHFDKNLITDSDIPNLAYLIGDEHQPEPGDGGWKNYPMENGGPSPSRYLHIDYGVYDGAYTGAVEYYRHEPNRTNLVDIGDWLWIRLERNGAIYICGATIIENYVIVNPTPQNTQTIGTHIYISTEKKYKIWLVRKKDATYITDENLWVGNNPDYSAVKQTSGASLGGAYSYVEYTWDQLKDISRTLATPRRSAVSYTWQEQNTNDELTLHGNLISNGSVCATAELRPNEIISKFDSVPFTIDMAMLSISPAQSPAGNYNIVISNERSGEKITCNFVENDGIWKGTGNIEVLRGDVLTFEISSQR